MFADLKKELRNQLSSTFIYDLWGRGRRAQQRRRFQAVLRRAMPTVTPAWASHDPALALQEKGSSRRQLPRDRRSLRVVGFGARTWGQYGLWPAWDELCHFALSEYGGEYSTATHRGRRPSPELRERQADGFLSFIDKVEAEEGPVHMAFFYAAGAHLDSRLMRELRGRGIWTVVMSLDDKRLLFAPHGHQLRIAPQCDLYWTTWGAGAALVAADGANPWCAPAGADPDKFRPLDSDRDIDALFLGQAYGERFALVDFLRRMGIAVQCYGDGWKTGHVDFDESIRLFARAKVVLGAGGAGYMPEVKHLKGRDFEVPMAGALYLTSFNPELCQHFDVGKEILCYSSLEECAELVAWAIANPSQAQQIRDAARERSLRDHTWATRLSQLIELFPR